MATPTMQALQSEGHALDLEGHKDAVKTFSSWAAHICKTRRTHRLAEMRKSGVATFEHDTVDDVAYRWEVKMCGDAADTQLNQQRAALFRDVATSSADLNFIHRNLPQCHHATVRCSSSATFCDLRTAALLTGRPKFIPPLELPRVLISRS